MIVSRLRTLDMPLPERFPCWYEMAAESHVSMIIDNHDRTDFRASISVYDLGAVQLSKMDYPALRVSRPARLIRRSDPEFLHVSLTTRGSVHLSQLGKEETVKAGSLVIYDTSRPCFVVNTSPVRQLVLQLPRALLGLRPADTDRLLAKPFAAAGGIAGMLAYVLGDVARQGSGYPAAVVPKVVTIITDLLLALHAAMPGTGEIVSIDSRQRLLIARVKTFIQHHLGEPWLSAEAVADAHQISLRHLNRLFQKEPNTISALIRQQRLDRCRRELIDPALAHRSAAFIGSRWGYPDPPAFSRAFRREFGLPPGDYRRQAGIGGS
jgi:AraC-like DNA-binding protein